MWHRARSCPPRRPAGRRRPPARLRGRRPPAAARLLPLLRLRRRCRHVVVVGLGEHGPEGLEARLLPRCASTMTSSLSLSLGAAAAARRRRRARGDEAFHECGLQALGVGAGGLERGSQRGDFELLGVARVAAASSKTSLSPPASLAGGGGARCFFETKTWPQSQRAFRRGTLASQAGHVFCGPPPGCAGRL